MCGIAGWVDFTRNIASHRAELEAMTATMACRGPDDDGIWLDRHVGLGHRRLAVIDLPGGRQPMTDLALGTPTAVISYSGEVYNFTELRDQLAARGHRFRTDSDTEVVLRGYLEWGERLPERLIGMFAFAVWDSRAQELLLVRDRLGIKPLYYYPLREGVLFGSEPKAILAHPEAEAVMDRESLQEFFTFANTPGHAIYAGMFQVRPGWTVRVGTSGIIEREYWSLPARPHEHDRRTTVANVRQLLERAVVSQTMADVPMGTLLSGGLDSSAVTALAACAVRERSHTDLHSFAVDFVGPSATGTETDAAYAVEVARAVGTEHHRIAVDTSRLTAAETRTAVVRARDLPVGFADMDASLYLLFGAVKEHATVVLSGEAADEVFGGYPWFHDRAAVQADAFPWASGYQAAHMAPSLFRPDLSQRLGLEEYVRDRYQQAAALVPTMPDDDEGERRMRLVCHLFLTHFLPVLLERKDRISMAVGLEVRVPFCDHRLIEYVVNVPWEMKSFDQREKSLLRAAASGLVPASVLERSKSVYPTVTDPAYERALAEQLADLVAPGTSSPIVDLIDVDAAQRILATIHEPEEGPWRFRRVLMESTIRMDEWMRDYRVRLS